MDNADCESAFSVPGSFRGPIGTPDGFLVGVGDRTGSGSVFGAGRLASSKNLDILLLSSFRGDGIFSSIFSSASWGSAEMAAPWSWNLFGEVEVATFGRDESIKEFCVPGDVGCCSGELLKSTGGTSRGWSLAIAALNCSTRDNVGDLEIGLGGIIGSAFGSSAGFGGKGFSASTSIATGSLFSGTNDIGAAGAAGSVGSVD